MFKTKENIIFQKNVFKNSKGHHCATCKYCTPSGNGNYFCEFSKPILIIKKEIPTNDYFWCNERGYECK